MTPSSKPTGCARPSTVPSPTPTSPDVREDQADADARSAAETAASTEVHDQAVEALRCLYSAQTYLQQLSNYEPPF